MKHDSRQESVIATYGTNVPKEVTPYLERYAEIYATVLHQLHVERKKHDFNLAKTKHDFQLKYGINARQLNGLRLDLDGRESSTHKCHELHLEELGSQIDSITKKISKLESLPATTRIRFQIHQKRRRLEHKKALLAKLKLRGPHVTFGSAALFRHQFNLEASGYRNHEEWLQAWRKARTSSFMLVGSKDETAGNLSAQLSKNQDGTYNLVLRVAPGLVSLFGPRITLSGLKFRWNSKGPNRAAQDIDYTLDQGIAVTIRFCRNTKKSRWSCRVMVHRSPVETISSWNNGAVGVDTNNGVLDATLIDRDGNLKATKAFPFRTSENANHDQAKAGIEITVNAVVDFAVAHKVPIVIEQLNFSVKKKAMKDSGLPNRKILSSFAYSTIMRAFRSRGQRLGVEIKTVNPAYSSVIGCAKFQSMFGLNSGTAAALVLARRGFRFSERVPKKVQVTLGLPVDGFKHVWTCWSALNRKLKVLKKNNPHQTEKNLRHLWFRTRGALSPAEVRLRDLDSSGFRGKGKPVSAFRETRNTNRRQHRSADVVNIR